MITEDYVSFEIAKLLKEKGFDDEYTNAFYDKKGNIYFITLLSDLSDHPDNDTDIAASTLYVAMKWLREKHHIHANPILQGRYDDFFENYSWCVSRGGVIYRNHTVSERLSYKEACEAAIKYCLTELIEDIHSGDIHDETNVFKKGELI